MTRAEALKMAKNRLEAISDAPQAEAHLLLEHLTKLSRTDLILNRQEVLTKAQRETLDVWLERRQNREPLQHILGVAPFCGLELNVTPDVLIPRPETERLVELVLKDISGIASPRILDVGTGSGAVALALKQEKSDALIRATDVSEAALRVARRNAGELGLEVTFQVSDLLANSELVKFVQDLNVLVANLPYLPDSDRETVSPEVQRDPHLALYSGANGLDLFRRLEAQAFKLLKPGALCWLELDPRNVLKAANSCKRWAEVSVFTDLTNHKRFLRLSR